MPKAMVLTELQQDLLTELFNLGVGQAAASLSVMVKQEIKLSVPHVEFLTISDLAQKLGLESLVCSVSQVMTGPFSAQSMLLFPEENSLEIVRQLLGRDLPEDTIIGLQQEAFSEIGNIVLNACIGSFSKALNTEFSVDLPMFEMAKPVDLLNVAENERDIALFLRIDLMLSESNITGYLAFLMGALSLEQLKKSLDNVLLNL